MNKARDHLSKKRSIKGYAKLAESNKLLQLLGEIPALQELIGVLGDNFIFTFDAINTQKKH